MLTCACLCDDLLLAHVLGEKSLPETVVDLMCPCMVEILSLQIDLSPSRSF